MNSAISFALFSMTIAVSAGAHTLSDKIGGKCLKYIQADMERLGVGNDFYGSTPGWNKDVEEVKDPENEITNLKKENNDLEAEREKLWTALADIRGSQAEKPEVKKISGRISALNDRLRKINDDLDQIAYNKETDASHLKYYIKELKQKRKDFPANLFSKADTQAVYAALDAELLQSQEDLVKAEQNQVEIDRLKHLENQIVAEIRRENQALEKVANWPEKVEAEYEKIETRKDTIDSNLSSNRRRLAKLTDQPARKTTITSTVRKDSERAEAELAKWNAVANSIDRPQSSANDVRREALKQVYSVLTPRTFEKVAHIAVDNPVDQSKQMDVAREFIQKQINKANAEVNKYQDLEHKAPFLFKTSLTVRELPDGTIKYHAYSNEFRPFGRTVKIDSRCQVTSVAIDEFYYVDNGVCVRGDPNGQEICKQYGIDPNAPKAKVAPAPTPGSAPVKIQNFQEMRGSRPVQ